MGKKRDNRITREKVQDKKTWLKSFENALIVLNPSYTQRIAGRIVWEDVEELFTQHHTPRWAAFYYLKKYK